MDTQLVRVAKAGDPAALETLFAEVLIKARKVAMRMLYPNHVGAVDDVVQDAMVSVFVHLQDFREDAAFSTWVYKIVVNSALMHLRSFGAREFCVFEEELFAHENESTNPHSMFLQEQTKARVHAAVAKLNPKRRAVVRACCLTGYTTSEYAELEGVSVAAVKARLHLGRHDVQRELGNE